MRARLNLIASQALPLLDAERSLMPEQRNAEHLRIAPRHKAVVAEQSLEKLGHGLILSHRREAQKMRADAFGNLRTEGSADTSPPALTKTRGYAQWLTAA